MAAPVPDEKLSEVFDKIWSLYKFLETCDDPTNSKIVQTHVEGSTASGERAIHMVNELSLFSNNEELEEVATSELKYMLLPGLLGYMALKNTQTDRRESLLKAQVYFVEFLRLCKLYGVTNVKVPKINNDTDEAESQPAAAAARPVSNEDVKRQMADRQKKIEKFKEKKQAEERLKELEQRLGGVGVDEEVQRDYYVTLLKTWVNTSLEELDSIKQELPILDHMAKMRSQPNKEPPGKKQQPPPHKKLQPFILTRDRLQAQVVGAGYPSLPTYSVEEWYQQQVDQGIYPASGQADTGTTQLEGTDSESDRQRKEEEAAEKERKQEQDDLDTLKKARDWDDWTDDHRRGWGNTQNKG